MRQAAFNELFGKIQSELTETRNAGQKEYAHGEVDDVFNNFNRVASAVGVDRKMESWPISKATSLSEKMSAAESRITLFT